MWVRLLKPSVRHFVARFLLLQISQQLLEVQVSGNALELLPRYGLQHNPRIVRQLPELWIELLPKPISGVIERPFHVQSQIDQRIRNTRIECPINVCLTLHAQPLLMTFRLKWSGWRERAPPKQCFGPPPRWFEDGPAPRSSRRKFCRSLPCPMDVQQTSHLWQLP